MEQKKLYRNVGDMKLCGVCSGVAEYFGWDPTMVRLSTAILAVLGVGAVVPIYIVAALILPVKN